MRRGPRGALRHADRIRRVRRAAVEGPGATAVELRRAAYEGGELPDPLGAYLAKVRDSAWTVGDDDIAALRGAGYSDDAVLELTVAAAAGAAGRRYDVGMRALREGA